MARRTAHITCECPPALADAFREFAYRNAETNVSTELRRAMKQHLLLHGGITPADLERRERETGSAFRDL